MIALAPLLLAAGVYAAPPNSKTKKEPAAIASAGLDNSDPTDLFGDQPIDWTKTYSLGPYREVWTLDIDVKDLKKDLPRILQLFEKAGSKPTIPVDQMAHSVEARSQQLSYRFPAQTGRESLKTLSKIGAVSGPKVSHTGEPISLAEVKEKLARLSTERDAHKSELALMPSVSMMVDEMIQHLTAVKRARESVDAQVVLYMTVREKR